MRAGSSLAALKERLAFICAATLTITALAIAAPAEAGRGISIDANTTEIWSDATDGGVVSLPFNVNYTQAPAFIVQLPQNFNITEGQQSFAAVGLQTFLDPNQILFATVNGTNGSFPQQVPALRLGSTTDGSQITMYGPADADNFVFPNSPIANVFEFGSVTDANMSSSEITSSNATCEFSGAMLDCYGPFTQSATFEFIDLSSSGNPGDFELILTCGELCGNIGFNLAGQSFSADDFNPNAPLPPNLVSYSLGDQNELFHPGTWDFIFRNAALPEPSTWASMLLGFGLLGCALRRQRRLQLRTS